jgi:hypothetical protein
MAVEPEPKKVRIKLSRDFKEALLSECKPNQSIEQMLQEKLGVTPL